MTVQDCPAMGNVGQGFTIVLRGYNREQVDAFIAQVEAGTAVDPAPSFSIALRGYERRQVDRYVESHRSG